MVLYLVMAVIAYLIGSVNFGVIISKEMAGIDVREKGSHGSGATNVLRTVGKKAAAITLVCDILKGTVSILIALFLGAMFKESASPVIVVQIAAFMVVIGHTFPVFFEFKGGKGVATSLGIILVVNWQIGLICLTFALVLMAITKMVSLGSVSAAILFPILTLYINNYYIVSGNYVIFGVLMALLVIYNHRSNIKRIMEGNENRLNFSKKGE